MKRSNLVPTLLLTLAGAACSGAMNVETTTAPPAALSGGSYSWASGTGGVAGNLQLSRNAGVDVLIREVIDEELAARGWRHVESGGDVDVAYVAALERELDVQEVNDLFRYRGRMWTVTNVEVRAYERGTLIIDLSDPEADEPLWRGAAEAELHRDDRDYRERRLREAVQAILAELPSGTDR